MRSGGNGWNSPSVILAIISLIMTVIAGYIALKRDDTEALTQIRERLRAMEVRVELLERRP